MDYLITLSNRYRAMNERIKPVLKPYGINLVQIQILYLLTKQPSNATQLMRDLVIESSNMTRAIDKLVRKDFVERVHDEDDRRVVNVAITDEGREVLTSILRTINIDSVGI